MTKFINTELESESESESDSNSKLVSKLESELKCDTKQLWFGLLKSAKMTASKHTNFTEKKINILLA